MERKNGETFKYEGKTLRVKEDKNYSCHDCFFNKRCTLAVIKMVGECAAGCREDNKSVVFVEVQDQAEQPQELNLCEILKNCPKGEEFWSPLLGDVKFLFIDEKRQMIFVETIKGLFTWEINADGTISIDEVTSPEIMLYPTREQRDWSKFTAPWYKKEKFNPKTFKPFDKVLYRAKQIDLTWHCDFFSYMKDRIYVCSRCVSDYVVPYNDDTKHLVGTKDEAPDFYKYWED